MNDFERRIRECTGLPLKSDDIEILQVNVGFRCNQRCAHCHLEASSEKKEMMEWDTMKLILDTAREVKPKLVDITGGAPELNPFLRTFIEALKRNDHNIQVRSNLTVLEHPGMEELMDFFRDTEVKLVASLPCHTKEGVDAVRGDGVFEASIRVLKLLNNIGYGTNQRLQLDLVYNPGGAFLPPEQSSLETKYHEELSSNFGIIFNNLLTLTNMPIGRFRELLIQKNQHSKYLRLLKETFNSQTINRVMCRHQINVSPNGKLYDCDYNLALGYPVDSKLPSHIHDFDPSIHSKREIVTGNHCFGCTAGQGSSCEGALVKKESFESEKAGGFNIEDMFPALCEISREG